MVSFNSQSLGTISHYGRRTSNYSFTALFGESGCEFVAMSATRHRFEISLVTERNGASKGLDSQAWGPSAIDDRAYGESLEKWGVRETTSRDWCHPAEHRECSPCAATHEHECEPTNP